LRGGYRDDGEWRHCLKHKRHAPQVIIEQNVKLVVVDSVAAIVRREFSKSSLIERQGVLAREAQILKQRENQTRKSVIQLVAKLSTFHPFARWPTKLVVSLFFDIRVPASGADSRFRSSLATLCADIRSFFNSNQSRGNLRHSRDCIESGDDEIRGVVGECVLCCRCGRVIPHRRAWHCMVTLCQYPPRPREVSHQSRVFVGVFPRCQ